MRRTLVTSMMIAALATGAREPGADAGAAASSARHEVAPVRLGAQSGMSSLGKVAFGFEPNQVTFDREGRPWVPVWPTASTRAPVYQRLDGSGKWATVDCGTALPRTFAAGPWRRFNLSPASFDSSGRIYTLADGTGSPDGRWQLLVSRDCGATWQAYATPWGAMPGTFKDMGDNANFARLERRNFPAGHNYPPIVLGNDAGHLLLLDVRLNAAGKPLFREVRLAKVLGDATAEVASLSHAGFGGFGHNLGTPVVSVANKVFVVFARPVPVQGQTGTPAYAVCYDRVTGRVGGPVYLGSGGIEIDGHNFPVIAADRAGHLHVILSAHGGKKGQRFLYRRSSQPASIGTWDAPQPLVSGCTYPFLLCDRRGTLHLVSRGPDGALVYDRKKAGGTWDPRRELVVAADRGRYALYSQDLSEDTAGRLFLSYRAMNRTTGVASATSDQKDYPPVLLVSEDGGETWQVADTAALVRLMRTAPDMGEN